MGTACFLFCTRVERRRKLGGLIGGGDGGDKEKRERELYTYIILCRWVDWWRG